MKPFSYCGAGSFMVARLLIFPLHKGICFGGDSFLLIYQFMHL
jgi:hypothetical protein